MGTYGETPLRPTCPTATSRCVMRDSSDVHGQGYQTGESNRRANVRSWSTSLTNCGSDSEDSEPQHSQQKTVVRQLFDHNGAMLKRQDWPDSIVNCIEG